MRSSLAGVQVPCLSADGMTSKPGPESPWIWPPSWFAATRKPTPAVAAFVARACTRSVRARIVSTPADDWVVNATDPKWKLAMAERSAASRRSLRSPIMKTCPMRCASLIDANVAAAQVSAPDGSVVGVGVPVADDGPGEPLAVGPGAGEVDATELDGEARGVGAAQPATDASTTMTATHLIGEIRRRAIERLASIVLGQLGSDLSVSVIMAPDRIGQRRLLERQLPVPSIYYPPGALTAPAGVV